MTLIQRRNNVVRPVSCHIIIYLLSCTLTMTAVVRDVPCEARFTEAPEATQRVLAVRMRGVT